VSCNYVFKQDPALSQTLDDMSFAPLARIWLLNLLFSGEIKFLLK